MVSESQPDPRISQVLALLKESKDGVSRNVIGQILFGSEYQTGNREFAKGVNRFMFRAREAARRSGLRISAVLNTYTLRDFQDSRTALS